MKHLTFISVTFQIKKKTEMKIYDNGSKKIFSKKVFLRNFSETQKLNQDGFHVLTKRLKKYFSRVSIKTERSKKFGNFLGSAAKVP